MSIFKDPKDKYFNGMDLVDFIVIIYIPKFMLIWTTWIPVIICIILYIFFSLILSILYYLKVPNRKLKTLFFRRAIIYFLAILIISI